MAQTGIHSAGFQITVNGQGLGAEDLVRVKDFQITQQVNATGDLSLSYDMSNLSDGEWHGDGGPFQLADRIEVIFGFDQTVVFEGFIVSIGVQFGDDAILTVNANDPLFPLQSGSMSRSFRFMSDAMIIEAVALEAGIACQIEPISMLHEFVFQDNMSDFAFIADRAKKNLYDFIYRDGALQVYRALLDAVLDNAEGAQNQVVRYKLEFDSFNATIQSPEFGTAVIVQGYDPAQAIPVIGIYGANLDATLTAGLKAELLAAAQLGLAAAVQPGAAPEIAGTLADITAEIAIAEVEALALQSEFSGLNAVTNVSSKLNLESPIYIREPSVSSQLEAEALAVAKYYELLQPVIDGGGGGIGNAELKAGTYITLEGLGKQYSGAYYVKSVTHNFDFQRGFTTQFSVTRRWYEQTLLS